MMPHHVDAPENDITGLLQNWRQGDRSALDRLVPLIKRELNIIAKRQLRREQNGPAIEPSSLIQEAFLNPEDVARVIAYLVSDEARLITGQIIHLR